MVKVIKKGKKAAKKGKEGNPEEVKQESEEAKKESDEAKKESAEAKKESAETQKESDKKEEKAKPQAAPAKKELTEEEVKLKEEAIKEILAGVATQKDKKVSGSPFIPNDWSTKYKPKLGPYKKFVLTQAADVLTIHERPNQAWVLTKFGDPAPPEPDKSANLPLWRKQLDSAWSTYCAATPVHERSIEVFTSALPKAVKQTKPVEQQKPADPAPIEQPGATKEDSKRKATEGGDAAKKTKKKAKKKG